MRSSIGRLGPALLVVILFAGLFVACGQVTESELTAAGLSGQRTGGSTQLIQAEVCVDGDPACTPTGAHGVHDAKGIGCKVCHAVGGRLSFQKNGPAYGLADPPTFDATNKTCSNVACHTVPAGVYTYYFQGGDGSAELRQAPFGGTSPGGGVNWYASGLGCTACHDNPASAPGGGKYVWHSGYHGGQGPTGAYNQCQFCHSDAVSTTGVGTGLSTGNCNPATLQPVVGTPAGSVKCSTFHANGTVNVTASFKTICFNCH